jgi:CDP-diacylglycerol---glycerol-3-phosphate 3-phosphatidyltransferase
MIGKTVGWFFKTWRDSWARGLVRLGVTPNALTVFGTLCSVAAGGVLGMATWTDEPRYSLLAGGFLFLAFAGDMLDGAVARIGGKSTTFGALLDSTLDRVSDFALWAGLGVGYILRDPPNVTFALLCMVGFAEAVLISYVKARAEDFVDHCGVGYWQRGERSAGIIIAAFACNPHAYVVELSILSLFTVLRRILHARALLAGRSPVTDARTRGRWYHKLQPWLYPRATWPYDLLTITYIAFLIFGPVDPDRWDLLRRWLGA